MFIVALSLTKKNCFTFAHSKVRNRVAFHGKSIVKRM